MRYASLAAFPAEGCSVSNMDVGSVRALTMRVVRTWEDGKLVIWFLAGKKLWEHKHLDALGLWEFGMNVNYFMSWWWIQACHVSSNVFYHSSILLSISTRNPTGEMSSWEPGCHICNTHECIPWPSCKTWHTLCQLPPCKEHLEQASATDFRAPMSQTVKSLEWSRRVTRWSPSFGAQGSGPAERKSKGPWRANHTRPPTGPGDSWKPWTESIQTKYVV